jgi:hypothetical protein
MRSFLAAKEITICPPRYVAPTVHALQTASVEY